ncbi:CheR family methyltransferase [Desulfonispora thiosulfatigenes]
MIRKKGKLKIWSAACSNGAEPYSVAMILDQLTPRQIHTIDATDIDDKILQDARKGCYKADLLKNVSPDRLAKYFTKDGDTFCLSQDIKNKVKFKKHDLIKDSYQTNYDLIICRNVTIYFTKEIQNQLYENFRKSLAPDGILFIGATESVLDHKELGFNKVSPWFYQKN